MHDEKIWEELERNALSGSEKKSLWYKEITEISGNIVFYSFCLDTRSHGIIIRYPKTRNIYTLPPSSRGFKVRIDNFGSDNVTSDLLISVAGEEYNDIFTIFAKELLRILSNMSVPGDLIEYTLRYLRKWQNFMEKLTGDQLTPNQRLGLFGELFFLYNTIIPLIGVRAAILSWYGPDKKQQDFLFENSNGVEIKTTISKAPVSLSISSEKQLDPTGFFNLFLHHIEVIEVKDSGKTLNDIVDQIRLACLDDPEISMEFMLKLTCCNYRQKDRKYYEDIGYSTSKTSTYLVSEDFPHITAVNLKDGICNVRYSILAAVLGPFAVEYSEFTRKIKEGYIV